MKRRIWILGLALVSVLLMAADLKISQLANKNDLAGPERFPFAQASTNGSTTASNLARWIGASGYMPTNNTIVNVSVINITSNLITTNIIVYQTNIANYTITTNLNVVNNLYSSNIVTTNITVYETNISNVEITTNLWVYQTNFTYWTITTNLTVIEQINFEGHNADVNDVWTCTNATTGAGEWQPVSGGSQVWTNDGTAIFPVDNAKPVYIGNPQDPMDILGATLFYSHTNLASGNPSAKFRFYGSPVPDNWATAMNISLSDGTNDYTSSLYVLNTAPPGPEIGFITQNLSSGLTVNCGPICSDLDGYSSGTPYTPYGSSATIIAFAAGQAKKQTAIYAQTYGTTGKFTTNSIAELYLKNYDSSNFVSGVNIGISSTDLSVDMEPEQTLLLLESYETGLPLIVARTNNGTHVFELGGDGVLYGNGAGLSNVVGVGVINNFNSTNIYTTNLYVSNITAKVLNVTQILWTNNISVIATNTTTQAIDWNQQYNQYMSDTLMVTNLVLNPTNGIIGHDILITLVAANGNYDVTVTNFLGSAIHWRQGMTNGSTSFTVTNGQRNDLYLTPQRDGSYSAIYEWFK